MNTSKNLTCTRPIECCPSFRVMAAGSHLEFEGHIHLKVKFYCFIAFLTHENIGLDTGIESVTWIFFMLCHIYKFWVMVSWDGCTPWRGRYCHLMHGSCANLILFKIRFVENSMRTKNWRSYDDFLPIFSGYCFLGAEITESYKNPPRIELGPSGIEGH